MDYLADFSTASDVFSMFAEQLKKTYFNILIKPEKLGKYVGFPFFLYWTGSSCHIVPFSSILIVLVFFRDVRLLILEHLRWSTIQKYQAVVDDLTVDELMEFVSSFKSELYAEGLVQGNFTSVVSFILSSYTVFDIYRSLCIL